MEGSWPGLEAPWHHVDGNDATDRFTTVSNDRREDEKTIFIMVRAGLCARGRRVGPFLPRSGRDKWAGEKIGEIPC